MRLEWVKGGVAWLRSLQEWNASKTYLYKMSVAKRTGPDHASLRAIVKQTDLTDRGWPIPSIFWLLNTFDQWCWKAIFLDFKSFSFSSRDRQFVTSSVKRLGIVDTTAAPAVRLRFALFLLFLALELNILCEISFYYFASISTCTDIQVYLCWDGILAHHHLLQKNNGQS